MLAEPEASLVPGTLVEAVLGGMRLASIDTADGRSNNRRIEASSLGPGSRRYRVSPQAQARNK